MAGFFHPHPWLLGVFVLGLTQAGAAPERTVPRIPVTPAPSAPAPPLLPDLGPADGSTSRKQASPVVALPPDLPPLGLPSDGELAPSFPDLPDLPDSSMPAAPKPAAGRPADDPGALPTGDQPGPGSTPPPPKATSTNLPFPVWHQSPKKARDIAMAERRCLLVVFSSSGGAMGSGSRQLSDEVLARPDFNEFALAHLVLANLFFTDGPNLKYEHELAREEAMANFKAAFKVRGFPTAILFAPDGTEIDRQVGYRTGHAAAYFQHLQQAVEGREAILFESERRRERLASQGYRTWTSAQGLKRFAKLLEFDAHSALLRDESGAELKVELKHLALPDREIITRRRLGRPLPKLATSEAAGEVP